MRDRKLPFAIAMAFAVAIGCSVIVPSELDAIACGNEGAVGPPACDPGFACRFGECTPCTATELCGDGIDNDCQYGADDGCGGQGGGAGAAGDGTGGGLPDAAAGNGGSLGGSSGDAGSGGGVGGEAAAGGSGGSAGTPGVGTPCTGDSECAVALGHFCVKDPSLFGVSASGTCSRGCCTSSDCGPDNVCFVSPRGNNLCFPGSLVNRPVLGTKSPGSSCGAGSECRSGLCDGAYCVDACCAHSDCGANLPHCTMRSVGGASKESFYCGKAGTNGLGQLCWNGNVSGSAACQSNYCLSGAALCTQRCCKKSDCTAAGSSWECVYANTTEYAGPVCAQVGSTGGKGIGETCAQGSECVSGWCVNFGAGNVCTDTCCKNEDCGDTSLFGCRPANAGGTGLLLCVAL